MKRRRTQGSLFGPIILVGLGALFLLNNFGLIDWDIRNLFQTFWPILLVAAGLDVLNGRRSVFSALLLVIFTVILLAVVGLGIRFLTSGTAWNVERASISRPLNNVSAAEVTIAFDAGSLSLEALQPISDTAESLIEGTITVDGSNRPEQTFRQDENTARYHLAGEGIQVDPILAQANDPRIGNAWNLNLNQNVPTRLQVVIGAGLIELDLSQLNLTDLDLETGLGYAEVTLPESGQLTADIHLGLGSLVVFIPEGMAARIESPSRLAHTFSKDYPEISPGLFISPDYNSAENRVDLRLSSDIGEIVVRQVAAP